MRPGDKSCNCPECGVVCGGQFDGCADVWARGLRPVTISAPASVSVANGAEWSPSAVLNPPAVGGPGRREVMTRATENARTTARVTEPPAASRSHPPDTAEPEPPPAVPPTYSAAPRRSPAPPPRSEPRPPEPPSAVGHPPTGVGQRQTTPVKLADSGVARTQLFQWFEAEFDKLRGDLQAVVGTVTQQQAMVAELLEDRHVAQRLSVLAGSLPEIVDEAVKSAVAEQMASVVESTDAAVGQMRDALARTDSWIEEQRQDAELLDSSLGELRSSLATLETLVEEQRADLASESARLRGVKSSLTRQIKPVVESIPQLVSDAVATSLKEHRREVDAMIEAAVGDLGRSVKISISRQLEPIAEALEDMARSRNTRSRSPRPRQSPTQD